MGKSVFKSFSGIFGLFFIQILLGTLPALAWEVSSFDCIHQKIENSAPFFNSEVNKRLDAVISSVNEHFFSCDKNKFMQEVAIELASSWFGNLETWAVDAPVSKCQVPFHRSAYRDLGWIDAPILNSVGLHPIVNINGHHIGVDKLAHFMAEGLQYYKAELAGKSLHEILMIGVNEEEGIMGWSTTSIKSYGDMTANYYGYLFWRTLVAGDHPYVKCQNNQWSRVREFRWEDFVNEGMDETINCNDYYNEPNEKSVLFRTAQIFAKKGLNQSPRCPIRPNECAAIYQSIGNPDVAELIMHPRCFEAARR